jgi:acyl carrier protein
LHGASLRLQVARAACDDARRAGGAIQAAKPVGSDMAAGVVTEKTAAELEMAALLVQALNLEEISADAIDPLAPLFGHDQSGLGLDSIDALEIALAIQQQYGVELRSDDANTKTIFGSLRALCAHVQSRRG